ncbi:cytochrome c [Thalassococcus sp. CAU 1522]|uniref:Cytochrome c n=1 Tax=Thalassococcus arenae TaxID=2851652 RepID=A0ABS6N3I4_9RHOB|nr:cytochrome c [Thalassococcus arenae]MBV2358574.1 cytochrome c [Thalassococcus arenae]
MANRFVIVAALAGLAGLAACVEPEMPGPSDGRALFVENCAVCHGETGKGDGPMARAMARAPRDLTLIRVRNGDSFPRARVLSTIDGYARSDLSGPGMPEFGDLLRGDLVPLDTGDGVMTPTPRKLVALLEYIESIQESR